MFKLYHSIRKEWIILMRDKAALAVIFLMPVLLVVVITSIQHSSLQLINDNKVPLLVCNRDGGESGVRLMGALHNIGMFSVTEKDSTISNEQLVNKMHEQDALIAVIIPAGFSTAINDKANQVTGKALNEFGIANPTEELALVDTINPSPIVMYYNPVLQESFRYSVQGALQSAQQFTENRQILNALYSALNQRALPDSLERQILKSRAEILEIPMAKDGSQKIPNATQHNVPAWTIFAMFFIVVSLSSSIVKEKISGSFIRLKTLPTNFLLSLLGKQITYITVTFLQAILIFSLGIFLFPYIGLPQLDLPDSKVSLFLVTLFCGFCAVSYGILVGVFSRTMEQAIGFGAVSIVILAAVGGIVVPAFAMPATLKWLMMSSPLHWCMESYNKLFLENAGIKTSLVSLLPVAAIILLMQLFSWVKLKRENLL